MLKLTDLHKLEIEKTVYKHSRNNLPFLLSRLFKKTDEISRHTRTSTPTNKYTLYIPRFRTARL